MSNELAADAAKHYWYHSIDLGDGVVTDGHYDMVPLLPQYGLPESMNGMEVLDVGCASGFFSFEMERRGASVTATELPSFLEWDLFGGDRTRWEYVAAHPEIASENCLAGFEFAHLHRRSKVKTVRTNVYDFNPEKFNHAKFDLVLIGSLTSHVRDPYLAFERIASITAGTAVFACPIFDIAAVREIPCMALNSSMKMPFSDRLSWWTFNELALDTLLEGAGFQERKVMSRFLLSSRKCTEKIPHIVIHAKI